MICGLFMVVVADDAFIFMIITLFFSFLSFYYILALCLLFEKIYFPFKRNFLFFLLLRFLSEIFPYFHSHFSFAPHTILSPNALVHLALGNFFLFLLTYFNFFLLLSLSTRGF